MSIKALIALFLSLNLAGSTGGVFLNLQDNNVNQEQIEEHDIGPRKISNSLGVDLGSKSGIVLDIESGEVFFEKNPNEKLPMASLTKMMTALVVLESGKKMEDTMMVDGDALRFYGAGIDLQVGEEVRIGDVMHGLLINSGNDAALALAKETGGSIEKFIKMMNVKASEIGMENTKFKNPHGLDAKGHYSTVHDLSILAQRLFKNPTVRKIILKKEYEFDSVDGSIHHYFKSTNMLLRDDYQYIRGGKTGFTDNAGHCFASLEKNEAGNYILTVVLGNEQDGGQFLDTKALTEWAFRNYTWE